MSPPSLLAIALLLQVHDRVSDAEAKRRADFDLCWMAALGIEIDESPSAKSTLQLFMQFPQKDVNHLMSF